MVYSMVSNCLCATSELGVSINGALIIVTIPQDFSRHGSGECLDMVQGL